MVRSRSSGFIVVDKPKGLTSHDVVSKVRRLLGKREKVGHTGTLDPLATGVLILAVGKATRLSNYLLQRDKIYRVKGRFGLYSPTYDVDGKLSSVECREVSEGELLLVLPRFTGEITQYPPPYSAIRVKGKRAYQLAREGKKVELPPRKVTVYSLKLLSFSSPTFELLVHCSSGTYIRSLVHDIGEALGCSAVVEELRRVCVGNICEDESVPLDVLKERGVEPFLKPPYEVLGFPVVELLEREEKLFKNGALIPKPLPPGLYSVLSLRGEFLGVGRSNGEVLKPEKVISVS